jgi:hypothetical protein
MPPSDQPSGPVTEAISLVQAVSVLALAKFFIDVRGPGGDDYHQSRIEPVQQTVMNGK